jgi:hypothetical protein
MLLFHKGLMFNHDAGIAEIMFLHSKGAVCWDSAQQLLEDARAT